MRKTSHCLARSTVSLFCLLSVAALFTAEGAPFFTDIDLSTNREVVLHLSGSAATSYRVDVSTNLSDWAGFQTVAGTNLHRIVDSGAPYLDSRFYRAVELGGPDILTGDHLVTTNGDAIIHPINHGTFVLGWNGRMIYVDPVGGATPFQLFPRADLILVTHGHGDHYNADTLNAVLGSNTVIIATQAVQSGMPANLQNLTTVLTNGAVTRMMGLTVEAVPAHNLTAAYHPPGIGNGYVLTIGGERIYVSGDTEDIPAMRALSNITVAFVCMNLPYTMTVTQAADAVRAFRPTVVYPYHYRNSDSTHADLDLFKSLLGTDLAIEVRLRGWY